MENSSLPAQGGEGDFLHLLGLCCSLRFLHRDQPQAVSRGRNQAGGEPRQKEGTTYSTGCSSLCTAAWLPPSLEPKTCHQPALKHTTYLSADSPAEQEQRQLCVRALCLQPRCVKLSFNLPWGCSYL